MKNKQTPKYCFVLLLSITLILATILISYMAYRSDHQKTEAKLKVVTSFVPMYTIALNLLDGVDQVSVTNLSAPKTGCLHDYEPTPADLKTLSGSDIFIVNGGGMEIFLDKAAKENPKLTIVDSSKGVQKPLEENAHYWLSVSEYQNQMTEVKSKLKKEMKARGIDTRLLEKNYSSYCSKLSKLKKEESELSSNMATGGKNAVLLQESFAYLARDLGVTVKGVTDLDEERQVSAKEVAGMIKVLHKGEMVWADPVYGQKMQKTLVGQTGAVPVTIDPVTVCETVDKDTYIERMGQNFSTIRKAGGM
ncbi:MAG: zinc ABC transporter substrate-binding protein [Lachnospiraceae bacterium]|nr:zinc ABC transporter substrate-binding protein [Lachnospiraceae bacterium]